MREAKGDGNYSSAATDPRTPAMVMAIETGRPIDTAPLALLAPPDELELPEGAAPPAELVFDPDEPEVPLCVEEFEPEPDVAEPAGTAAARLATLVQDACALVDASPCL